MKTIWNKFNKNLGLKIIAVFFAIIIWSFVISVNDPLRTRTLENVPLHIIGLEKLEEAGLIIRNDEVLNPVTIKADVKISEINRLNLGSVQVTADLSDIQRKGQYEIYLTGETTVGSVVSVSPAVITLDVDQRTTRAIPVSYAYKGQIGDSLHHLDPVLSTSRIEITGAQQDVVKVTSAVVNIDLSALNESINGSYSLILVDKDNAPVSSDYFVSTLPSVMVKMDVFPKKTIALNNEIAACVEDVGAIAPGYRITSISFSKNEITVYGPADPLSSLQSVSIRPVRVDGLRGTKTFEVELLLPQGVVQISAVPISMSVTIAPINP